MLFRNQNARIKKVCNMHPIIFLPLFIAVITAISACSETKGSIVVLENPNGTGFTINLNKWSLENKCELSLSKGDVLQIEVSREGGKIALTVRGKKGREPYTGSNLESGLFTVTVSETDKYDILITGKDATGKVTIKKVQL
jgi:hypothetical protein